MRPNWNLTTTRRGRGTAAFEGLASWRNRPRLAKMNESEKPQTTLPRTVVEPGPRARAVQIPVSGEHPILRENFRTLFEARFGERSLFPFFFSVRFSPRFSLFGFLLPLLLSPSFAFHSSTSSLYRRSPSFSPSSACFPPF